MPISSNAPSSACNGDWPLKGEPGEDSQRVVVGRIVACTVVIGRPTVELRKDPILNSNANVKSGTK
jgi:hypothetical protein